MVGFYGDYPKSLNFSLPNLDSDGKLTAWATTHCSIPTEASQNFTNPLTIQDDGAGLVWTQLCWMIALWADAVGGIYSAQAVEPVLAFGASEVSWNGNN